MATEL
jgi:hypothetical protein